MKRYAVDDRSYWVLRKGGLVYQPTPSTETTTSYGAERFFPDERRRARACGCSRGNGAVEVVLSGCRSCCLLVGMEETVSIHPSSPVRNVNVLVE